MAGKIERPMLSENKKPIPNYFCFFIFSNSKFDVGRSMFDVHSFSGIKTFQRFTKFCILYPDFCLLNPLIHTLGDKAP